MSDLNPQNEQQKIEEKPMGSLFRRMTLASLGLDSLSDVSDHSVAVIDRADAFASRLLNGMTSVLPDENSNIHNFTPKIGNRIGFSSPFESSLAGPKSASDVGEWQNWLDAVLLMLFDDEEYEGMEETEYLTSNLEAVKKRVQELAKSGIKPESLNKLSAAQKREVFAKLQNKQNTSQAENRNKKISALKAELARSIQDEIQQFAKLSSISDKSARLNLDTVPPALHHITQISEKLAKLEGSDSPRQQWNNAVSAFVSNRGISDAGDKLLLKNMSSAVSQMFRDGLVDQNTLDAVRTFESKYIVSQAEKSRPKFTAAADPVNSTSCELAITQLADKLYDHAIASSFKALKPYQPENKVSPSLAHLADKLDALSEQVEQKVARSGENALTLQWSNAVDRYRKQNGVFEETDKVLLRDVAEAAEELSRAGIISREESGAAAYPRAYVENDLFGRIESSMQRVYQSVGNIITAQHNSDVQNNFSEWGKSIFKFSEQRGQSFEQDITLLGDLSEKVQNFLKTSEADLSFVKPDETSSEQQSAAPGSPSAHADALRKLTELATGLKQLKENGHRLSSTQFRAITSRLSDDYTSLASESSILMDNHIIDGAYFKSLGSDLQLLRRISDNSISTQLKPDQFSSIESRLSRMLDLIAVPEMKSAPKSRVNHLADEAEFAHVSLQEITPDAQKIRQMEESLSYARQAQFKDQLIAMFGADKAVLKHANTLISNAGKFDADAFSAALSQSLIRDASAKNATHDDAASLATKLKNNTELAALLRDGNTSFKVSHSGSLADTLKVDLSLVKQAYDELSLKMQTGKAYLPAQYRNISEQPAIAARLELVSPSMDLGTTDFIPVMLGAAQRASETAARQMAFEQSVKARQASSTMAVDVEKSLLQPGSVQTTQQAALSFNAPQQTFATPANNGISQQASSVPGATNSRISSSVETNTEKALIQSNLANQAAGFEQTIRSRQMPETSQQYADIEKTWVQASSSHTSATVSSQVTQNSGMGYYNGTIGDSSSGISLNTPQLSHIRKLTAQASSLAGISLSLAPDTLLHVASDAFGKSTSVSELSDAFNLIDKKFVTAVSQNPLAFDEQNSSQWIKSASTLRDRYLERFAQIENAQPAAMLKQAQQTVRETSAARAIEPVESLLIRGYPVLRKFADLESSAYPSSVREYSSKVSAAEQFVPVSTSLATMGIADENTPASHQNTSSSAMQNIAMVAQNLNFSDNKAVSGVSQNSRFSAPEHLEMPQVKSQSYSSDNFLESIDSLLDHVERVYDRSSEVLSSASVQMVHYSTTPSASLRPDEGLPSWRRKKSENTFDGIDVNELHDILRKVGAMPIQGITPANERKFINPFISIPETKNAEAQSSSTTSNSQVTSSASTPSTTTKYVQAQPTHEDIANIAEEVYFKILDSLSEELQRRRSE